MQTFPRAGWGKGSNQRHLLAVLPRARKAQRFHCWKPPVVAGRGRPRGAARKYSNSRVAVLAFSKNDLKKKKETKNSRRGNAFLPLLI